MASVLSLSVLTYQFKDQFLMVSAAWEAGATSVFLGKKNNTVYFNAGMENGLMQPSFEYFVMLLVKSNFFLINLYVSIRRIN